MSGPGTTPLFVDTGAFYARADEDDKYHEAATRVFDEVRRGELRYGPIYTSQAVLSELATLCLYNLGHADAVRTLTAISESESFNVLPVDRPTFEAATEQFGTYDDQDISFVDHTSGVLAERRDVDRVFGFDPDDFHTLGFTVVPHDT
jgi:predicted nucleic acid-binding protein